MLADDMVPVQAGWFTAGCTGAVVGPTTRPETPEICVVLDPPRRLWLSSFEIDRRETPRGEYRRCVDDGACPEPRVPALEGDERVPVEVEHAGAAAFCAWRGKRLPTALEWQKAARGTDDRIFPWGDDPPTCLLAAVALPGCDSLVAVGQHPRGRSPFGAEDMFGNAAEWVADPATDDEYTRDGEIRFTTEIHDGYSIQRVDWAALHIHWADPTLVDPAPARRSGPEADREYVYMGAPTIDDRSHGGARTRVGFRCARSVTGPPPPAAPVAPDRTGPAGGDAPHD